DPLNHSLLARIFHDMPENHRVAYLGDVPVGSVCTDPDGDSLFLMLYVHPQYRRQGIGRSMLEHALQVGRYRSVRGFFNLSDPAAAAFTKSCDFTRTFDSDYMEFTGTVRADRTLCVRQYRDADYEEAHEMYAQAFHRMRVQVGDFPNSVPAPPSEKNRRAWASDAENYFVCLQGEKIVAVAHLGAGEISSVSVHPTFQGQGIGSLFVPYLIHILQERGWKTVSLECVAGNPARRLYDRLGFQVQYTERFVEKKTEKRA
ncbi:MAG: GNAT family N-acetyltransferase, partial [Clostridia bacterium]|nr:GNAT family N-acetyltransferase [Clostridia bacterium]